MATNYGGDGSRGNSPRSGGYGGDRAQPPGPTLSVNDIKLERPIPLTLFSEIAQEKAAAVHIAGAGSKNKSTQLRRFYDELVMWFETVHRERTSEAKSAKFAEVAPFIRMLNAKVAYAKGRNHVEESFERMFSHVVNQIKDVDSLKNAKLFMEAFMGFYKAQEK